MSEGCVSVMSVCAIEMDSRATNGVCVSVTGVISVCAIKVDATCRMGVDTG